MKTVVTALVSFIAGLLIAWQLTSASQNSNTQALSAPATTESAHTKPAEGEFKPAPARNVSAPKAELAFNGADRTAPALSGQDQCDVTKYEEELTYLRKESDSLNALVAMLTEEAKHRSQELKNLRYFKRRGEESPEMKALRASLKENTPEDFQALIDNADSQMLSLLEKARDDMEPSSWGEETAQRIRDHVVLFNSTHGTKVMLNAVNCHNQSCEIYGEQGQGDEWSRVNNAMSAAPWYDFTNSYSSSRNDAFFIVLGKTL